MLGGHNAITSETEWPTVSWESIIAANPDVIVVASLDRNRWALDKAEEKIKFLKSDPRQPAGGGEKKPYRGHGRSGDESDHSHALRRGQVGEQLRKMGLN